MTRVPATFPHYGDESGGFAVLLLEPSSGIAIGLHHDEVTWAAWLDEQRVEHSAINDVETPMPYSALILRDSDNIQLELFFMAG